MPPIDLNAPLASNVDAVTGRVTIEQDCGMNPDNTTRALRRWDMDPVQGKRHLDGGMFATIKAGDKTAIRDAAQQTLDRIAQDAKNL